MGGITGWTDRERDLTGEACLVSAMTATMAHRGPDGSGTWLSPQAALGCRWLDTGRENGPQLVTAPPGGPGGAGIPSAVLAFSGQLFNDPELRARLRQSGSPCPAGSDADVVLAAYLAWGQDAFALLDGMYAVAIWDARTEELLLVRDRLGVMPLYWASHPSGILFGSEPKALLANPLFPPEVDAEGLAALFTTAIKPPGAGVYRNLREVRPGYIVRASRTGVRHQRYWELIAAPHADDLPATVSHVRHLLTAAVARQATSGVPRAALLSGGLDSSAITALAAAGCGAGTLATYCLDFDGSETSFRADALHLTRDAPYARAVASYLGTAHTDVIIQAPPLAAELDAALRARDMPGAGDLDVSLLLLFREVRKHAAVVLSGEGADDFFGGYPWFSAEASQPTSSFPWSAGITDRNSLLSAELRSALDLDAWVADSYATALAEVPRLDGETGTSQRMREVFYLQLTRFLPFLNDRKDRMSMASGLQVRAPFCDHRLAEYLWNVPWHCKRAGGQDKGLLREAVAGLLPAEVLQRPKSGFPFGQQPAYLEIIRQQARAVIDDPASPVLDLINASTVRHMAGSGALHTGTFTPPPWLPRVIQLNAWLREYNVRLVL